MMFKIQASISAHFDGILKQMLITGVRIYDNINLMLQYEGGMAGA